MSIVTLKRKTQAKYNNMSVGQKNGFSINGGHRNQGYIGQTSLSRSLGRTLMNDNTIKGHGGCCGTYPILPIVESAVNSTEDSTVIKSSVLSTSGLISSKYRWIRRGYPYATVKPDGNHKLNAQDDYITKLRNTTIKDANACYEVKPCENTTCSTSISNITMFSKRTNLNYAKPQNTIVAMSQGQYILALQDNCSADDVFYVQSSLSRTPIN